MIFLVLGHAGVSALIISPSEFKNRTAFPMLTSMDRAHTCVIIEGISFRRRNDLNKDWKIHIVRSRNQFKGWQLLLKKRCLYSALNWFVSARKSLFWILFFQ